MRNHIILRRFIHVLMRIIQQKDFNTCIIFHIIDIIAIRMHLINIQLVSIYNLKQNTTNINNKIENIDHDNMIHVDIIIYCLICMYLFVFSIVLYRILSLIL